MTFCARIRFILGTRLSINEPGNELVLADNGEDVRLLPSAPNQRICDARHLALVARGYATEAEAWEAGDRWRSALQKAFARLNIGANFGDRAATGAATKHFLEMLKEQHGCPVLNDVHGLMVFECHPWPKFFRTQATGVVGHLGDRVPRMVMEAARLHAASTDVERLAYDLYSASFSEVSADARFVMLMMAVETLIDPAPRESAVVEHVERLIEETSSSGLPRREIESIVGSLKWLRDESIGHAGRRLAQQIQGREYMDKSPARFFTDCYTMRSRLVHGYVPRPSRDEVDRHAAVLEIFVKDLLSIELLHVPLD